jgi:CRP/FNR family transcriptional regulator, anaerobic regulatory protein
MLSKLYAHIAQNATITEELKQTIEQYFTPLQATKNTIIEEEGKIPRHLYFINEGYLRSFYYDNNGDEVTTYLANSEHFIASFLNLSQQKIST